MEGETKSDILVTGGAGIHRIQSLRIFFVKRDIGCVVWMNFATGHRHNLKDFVNHPNFKLVEGDIRNLSDCEKAVQGVDYVLHQKRLGFRAPIHQGNHHHQRGECFGIFERACTSRDAKVKRFVYLASSSTYGDSQGLPKVEEVIGKPLSPYAITKYVNELYADIFSRTYGLETIGLRYFNVFGRKQDPKRCLCRRYS